MNKKVTLKKLQNMKGKEKIVMITAYDALFTSIFDSEVEIILVGDSLNMSFAGKEDTLSVTMNQMIYHTQAVCRKAHHSFVLFDMPFGTYTDKKMALKNANRAYQETRADAIKLEGGKEKAKIIKYLTKNSIAVFGHIGLKPQQVRAEGGYSIKGKEEEEKSAIIEDAIALEKAGAVALIIEGVKPDVAKSVTESVNIPTIGIGAGVNCDGQVLVWSDTFGFFEEFMPKFVKQYLDGGNQIKEAIKNYSSEVKSEAFPDDNHTY
ncbi:3-methyl-2-oxobutanoate hydroxymethyltransferase [hydrothermal vent metagenome]|uniref:3-methyl-2-oxobutanoate hydroxymethyltransferase n=1 Tax=hydrothermal vent metagenome TaxID=652676 RepID=A0A1W1CA19_9ZZZZ